MIVLDGTSSGSRFEALENFVARWYGDDGLRAPKPLRPGDGCPPAIERWMRVATAGGRRRGVQNELVDPELLDDEAPLLWSVEPRPIEPAPRWWIFYVENQGVVTWAAEEDGADPAVWARCDFAPTHADAWVKESETLSGVLIKAVLLEALLGTAEGGQPGRIPRELLTAIQESHGLKPLPLRPQEAPLSFWPNAFMAAETFIAAVYETEDDDEVEITFGSSQDGALDFLEELVDDPSDFGL